MNRSYHAILCSQAAHIHEDECGAPEKLTGSKLVTLPHDNGKITPEICKLIFVVSAANITFSPNDLD